MTEIDPQPSTASADKTSAEWWTIGEIAAEFGMTLRTLRFYESEGLVTPKRSKSNRLYSRRDRARLALIARGKRLGFSVSEIREFLELYGVDPDQTEQMTYLLSRARAKIEQLKIQRQDIEKTLGELCDIERQILHHLNEE